MNPHLLFWVPLVLRLLLALVIVSTIGYFWSLPFALLTLCVILLWALISQFRYLQKLSLWLDHTESSHLDESWGMGGDVFAKLYRLRRVDEKNKHDLQEWLTRFRETMALLPDGVMIIDNVLFLEWCNRAAEQHLGLRLAADRGARLTNLLRDPAFIDYLILGRFEQSVTITRDNKRLQLQVIPFQNNRRILVSHDITQSEKLDAMRRDFIANASHELRTPLTVINGFLEHAQEQNDMDAHTRAAQLQLMAEQGARMQRLVDDMLTLTRLESLDFPLREEIIDMRRLLADVLSETQAFSIGQYGQAGQHHLTVQVDEHDYDVKLRGNYDELRSALANLMSNAVRYTPAKGNIVLSWCIVDSEGVKQAQLCVQDSGIGIEAQHLNRLTERFYRVDKARSRETHGTGLGLAIVKHVLLRHQATLSITSQAHQGSRFCMTFSMQRLVSSSAEIV